MFDQGIIPVTFGQGVDPVGDVGFEPSHESFRVVPMASRINNKSDEERDRRLLDAALSKIVHAFRLSVGPESQQDNGSWGTGNHG